jgi:hypothetical protein
MGRKRVDQPAMEQRGAVEDQPVGPRLDRIDRGEMIVVAGDVPALPWHGQFGVEMAAIDGQAIGIDRLIPGGAVAEKAGARRVVGEIMHARELHPVGRVDMRHALVGDNSAGGVVTSEKLPRARAGTTGPVPKCAAISGSAKRTSPLPLKGVGKRNAAAALGLVLQPPCPCTRQLLAQAGCQALG